MYGPALVFDTPSSDILLTANADMNQSPSVNVTIYCQTMDVFAGNLTIGLDTATTRSGKYFSIPFTKECALPYTPTDFFMSSEYFYLRNGDVGEFINKGESVLSHGDYSTLYVEPGVTVLILGLGRSSHFEYALVDFFATGDDDVVKEVKLHRRHFKAPEQNDTIVRRDPNFPHSEQLVWYLQ